MYVTLELSSLQYKQKYGAFVTFTSKNEYDLIQELEVIG